MIIGRNERAFAIVNRYIACRLHKAATEIGLAKSREGACLPGKGGLCTVCGTGDCLRRPE